MFHERDKPFPLVLRILYFSLSDVGESGKVKDNEGIVVSTGYLCVSSVSLGFTLLLFCISLVLIALSLMNITQG